MREDFILEQIRLIRQPMPRIGCRKLHALLTEKGITIGRDALFKLLRENNLLIKRRKKYAITTNSKHWMKKYPNLIRGFHFTKANQLWVSDITYIPIEGDFVFLFLITDVYSRLIVGYHLSHTLERDGAVRALEMALKRIERKDLEGLIHHSDRGSQYCSYDYVNLLKSKGIRISMTESGDPYQNAVAERVNGILKGEWLDHEHYTCFDDIKNRIDEIIDIYNTQRPHLSCDMKTPIQAYAMTGEIKRHWKKRKYQIKKLALSDTL